MSRQDSVTDQLRDLIAIANRKGMYDAADYLYRVVANPSDFAVVESSGSPETPATCEQHRPIQHRDGKPPWCSSCGLTADFQEPISFLLPRPRPVSGGEQ